VLRVRDGDSGYDPPPRHLEEVLSEQEAERLRARRLREAVATLPPGQRATIVLHRLEELSAERVGERLRLQPVTVRVRTHRAQKRLAEALG
jgi:RNA polymerase sigma factor (sigma-70 family)